WQHSACAGVKQEEAEREDFHFVCRTCRHRIEEKKKKANHPPIKLIFRLPGASSSPPSQTNGTPKVQQAEPPAKDELLNSPSVRPPVVLQNSNVPPIPAPEFKSQQGGGVGFHTNPHAPSAKQPP